MKRLLPIFFFIMLLFSLLGCSSVKQEEFDALLSEKTDLDNKVAELEEQLKTYEPYQDIVEALNSEKYDGAIARISQMKTEKVLESVGDINDYFMTVELTADNFSDYFEFVSPTRYNAFGDEDGMYGLLVSKLYDDGWVIYKGANDIEIEYVGVKSWVSANPANYDTGVRRSSLDSLLSGNGYSYYDGQCLPSLTGRIAGSPLTFINKDYIASYEVEKAATPDRPNAATITLLNGEKVFHFIVDDYRW